MANRAYQEVSLPKGAATEIATLLKYADQLQQVIAASKRVAPTIWFAEAIRPISKETSLTFSEVRKLFSAFENMHALTRELGSTEAAFEKVAEALEEGQAVEWHSKKDVLLGAIKNYTEDNPVALSIKAQRLSFQREKLFRDAEIITDARPVYDSTGEKILEMIITHSLALTYASDGNRTNQLHIALDAADVLKLRKSCDRAVVKAKTLKSALAENTGWAVEILRDDDDVTG